MIGTKSPAHPGGLVARTVASTRMLRAGERTLTIAGRGPRTPKFWRRLPGDRANANPVIRVSASWTADGSAGAGANLVCSPGGNPRSKRWRHPTRLRQAEQEMLLSVPD